MLAKRVPRLSVRSAPWAGGGGLADVGLAAAAPQPVTYLRVPLTRRRASLRRQRDIRPDLHGKGIAVSWDQVGPPGANGTNGNTIWNGTALPPATTGANGDFYLDTVTHSLFGPKANGQWPTSGTSLVGPAGLSGNTILNGTTPPTAGTGSNGDFYLDTVLNALYGPKTAGAWPPTGTSLIGPAGPSGAGATVATAAPGQLPGGRPCGDRRQWGGELCLQWLARGARSAWDAWFARAAWLARRGGDCCARARGAELRNRRDKGHRARPT